MKRWIVLLLLVLLGMEANTAMAQECITVMLTPLDVSICHDGTVVEWIEDEFGQIPVYMIDTVKFTNPTGAPWRLSADDEVSEWSTLLSANSEGERVLPPPQQWRSYPLTFRITLVRN